ncbi:inositol monophosphatase family protein [Chrysosporum ovalisporum APH033B]|uniref:inositol monophosphatase family protein n=1 Tax=Umezakia ovalisporum TaxID=75695 RepID=UPI0024740E3B|nr:inositol monophosphatase family protein [Umezakia ovalisporum]MDH6067757.1 inositol monophosphatase family protein [Umezakia ovalisporum APH033B]MDH6073491.1 inositol monophosphatase family protein [Umezakia ovalisporum CS-1034]
MNDFWTTILDFAQTTTTRVAQQLMQDFGQVQASQKADGSLVTQADKWADQEIEEGITAHFPGHGILSEESNKVFPVTEWCWVIDPLDGTTNFARGLPIWSISMGLLYHGTPVFGYVYVPPLAQTFHGFWVGSSGLTMPSGAFLNHKLIHSSGDAPSKNHFFNLCSRSTSVIQPGFPCKIRMLGVASYNFLTVAAGAAVGGIEATPKVWDIAGAWVIVQAAGGSWISLHNEPFPLLSGEDYSDRSFPTLVVSRPELVAVFTPFLESLRKNIN